MPTRKLRVFLCHASDDKPATRTLYASLKSIPWIDPWLDEENLLPGQDWNLEIEKAIRAADTIIICISKVSVGKEGYVNKEIRRALDIAEEKPEGTIYVIPLRLDDCIPSFEQLKRLQWVDYFTPNAHEKLLKSLCIRAEVLKIEIHEKKVEPVLLSKPVLLEEDDGLDLYRFIKIDRQKYSKVTYPFWIGKYPVTNAQYERFLKAHDFDNPIYWLEFPKFDENCKPLGDWGRTSVDWLKEQLEKSKSKVLLPRYWDNKDFGKFNPNHPVIGISWYEASAYCKWLFQNWDTLAESQANSFIKPQSIRLPIVTEWVIAADGDEPDGRYPWDEAGKATTALEEILRRANVRESEISRKIRQHTTSVNQYVLGKSPFGVMDMAGNVWEWQSNYSHRNEYLALRGGSWDSDARSACVSSSHFFHYPNSFGFNIGFRILCIPE